MTRACFPSPFQNSHSRAFIILQILAVKTVSLVGVREGLDNEAYRTSDAYSSLVSLVFTSLFGAFLLTNKLQGGCWHFDARMIRIVGCVFSTVEEADTVSPL